MRKSQNMTSAIFSARSYQHAVKDAFFAKNSKDFLRLSRNFFAIFVKTEKLALFQPGNQFPFEKNQLFLDNFRFRKGFQKGGISDDIQTIRVRLHVSSLGKARVKVWGVLLKITSKNNSLPSAH